MIMHPFKKKKKQEKKMLQIRRADSAPDVLLVRSAAESVSGGHRLSTGLRWSRGRPIAAVPAPAPPAPSRWQAGLSHQKQSRRSRGLRPPRPLAAGAWAPRPAWQSWSACLGVPKAEVSSFAEDSTSAGEFLSRLRKCDLVRQRSPEFPDASPSHRGSVA